VARLANFGAFVTLEEGVDGLIHISKLGGGKHLKHAQEALKLGEQLTVTIDKIDREQRRISLVPAAAGGEVDEAPSSYADQPSGGGMGSLGDLLKARMEKQNKKKS